MRGVTAAVLTALCFSTIGILVKLIGNDVPIMTLSFLRVLLAFVFLGPFFYFFLDKNVFRIKKRDLFGYILVGILMGTAIALFQLAMLLVPVANAVLLDASWMIFAPILAFVFLREAMAKKEWLLVGLAFVGIAVMNPFSGAFEGGNLVALSEGVVYAILIVVLRYEEHEHSLSAVFWFLLFATIFLSPAPVLYGFGDVAGNLHWILMLGIIPGAMAYLLLTYSLKILRAGQVAIIENISHPIFAVLLAIILINDVVKTNILIGGAILLLSALLLKLPLHVPKLRHPRLH